MKYNLFALIFVIASVSCGTAPEEEQAQFSDTASQAVPSRGIAIAEGCYRMVQNRDTALLSLKIVDTTVSGNLEYRRFEKDRNTGTIKGVIRDSLVIADYTFQSEGSTSVRQVVFLMKDGTLVEAYGDITMSGDTARFADLNRLQYMTGAFAKDTCAASN